MWPAGPCKIGKQYLSHDRRGFIEEVRTLEYFKDNIGSSDRGRASGRSRDRHGQGPGF